MRETRKVILPKTKKEVEIVTYITAGEEYKIEEMNAKALSVSGSMNGKEVDQKMSFDPTTPLKIKKLKIEIVAKTISGEIFSWERYEELPREDGRFLFDEAEKLFPSEPTQEDIENEGIAILDKKKEEE